MDELSIHPSRDIRFGIIILDIHFWQADLLGLLITQHQPLVQFPADQLGQKRVVGVAY